MVAAAKLAISGKDEINTAVAWRLMTKDERSHLLGDLTQKDKNWLGQVVVQIVFSEANRLFGLE